MLNLYFFFFLAAFFELFFALKKTRKFTNTFFAFFPALCEFGKTCPVKGQKTEKAKKLKKLQLEKLHENKVSSGSQVFCLRQLQLVASQCGKLAVKRRGKVTVP